VPKALWDVREKAAFINLAKAKADLTRDPPFYSLSMTNLFGLIPDPSRRVYHGADYVSGLPRSIADACALYHALFPVVSVCEIIHNPLVLTRPGEMSRSDGLVENLGLAAASASPVELDAFLVALLGGEPSSRHFLRVGAEVFGGWDSSTFPALPEEVAARLHAHLDTEGEGT